VARVLVAHAVVLLSIAAGCAQVGKPIADGGGRQPIAFGIGILDGDVGQFVQVAALTPTLGAAVNEQT
jgi:hypothetical protein